jgi:hypothetical protein
MFLYGMKAPMTRKKYGGRLAKFFDFVGLEGPIEERAQAFVERGAVCHWYHSSLACILALVHRLLMRTRFNTL